MHCDLVLFETARKRAKRKTSKKRVNEPSRRRTSYSGCLRPRGISGPIRGIRALPASRARPARRDASRARSHRLPAKSLQTRRNISALLFCAASCATNRRRSPVIRCQRMRRLLAAPATGQRAEHCQRGTHVLHRGAKRTSSDGTMCRMNSPSNSVSFTTTLPSPRSRMRSGKP